MSGHMDFDGVKVFTIFAEGNTKCEDCGQMEECRPYGKNGASVCFDCAMKDEPNAARLFKQRLDGD